jgi:hypothetical protein
VLKPSFKSLSYGAKAIIVRHWFIMVDLDLILPHTKKTLFGGLAFWLLSAFGGGDIVEGSK